MHSDWTLVGPVHWINTLGVASDFANVLQLPWASAGLLLLLCIQNQRHIWQSTLHKPANFIQNM